MIYSIDILREFVITAYPAAGELTPADAEPEWRKARASRSFARDTAHHPTNITIGRWSPEQRVKVARALADKGLPALLDVLISFDGKEQEMLRVKSITDES